MDEKTMVTEMFEAFLGGWLIPIPFFFAVYLARQLKKFFTDASKIEMD